MTMVLDENRSQKNASCALYIEGDAHRTVIASHHVRMNLGGRHGVAEREETSSRFSSPRSAREFAKWLHQCSDCCPV